MWVPAKDPGTEKGQQMKIWVNSNEVCSLVNFITPMLIPDS
jgi:hypothetical protein